MKLSVSNLKKHTENQNQKVSCTSNGIIMFSANCKLCNIKKKKLVKKVRSLWNTKQQKNKNFVNLEIN